MLRALRSRILQQSDCIMSLLANPPGLLFPSLRTRYYSTRGYGDCCRAEAITALGHPLILGRVVINVKELQYICPCFLYILLSSPSSSFNPRILS